MELVAIGSTEFLPGFALAGVRNTVLANKSNVMELIQSHQDAGLIILEEELTVELPTAQRQAIDTSTKPVILILGKQNTEHDQLRRTIISTLGVDLLK